MLNLTPKTAAAILAYAGHASAFWRMPCKGIAAVAPIDPIVDTGKVAGHMHTIKGASGLTTDCTVDDLLKSDCTSCQISQDKSSYWTPQLYFVDDSGDIEAVPETSGAIVYYKYTPAYTSKGLKDPVALPNGLRVLAGDTTRRNFSLPVPDPPQPWSGEDATQEALSQKAIGFNCMNYFSGKKPEDTLYRHTMPEKSWLDSNCPDGLRLEVLFPYCWNGEDLDSKNHKSHMAFPDQAQNGGKCPDGYDVVVNQVLFETIFPTNLYSGRNGYFTLSNGDATGNGYHGDLFVAWEEGVLQEATEKCGPVEGPGANGVVEECPVFNVVDDSAMSDCKIPVEGDLKYNMKETLKKLPLNNAISWGPEPVADDHHDDEGPALNLPKASEVASKLPKPAPFSRGSSDGFTDELGNIYKEQATHAPKPTPAKAEAPEVPAAQITPPVEAPKDNKLPAVKTIVSTVAGVVYEKVIVQEDVYVNAGDAAYPTAIPKRRRHEHHLHQHQHAHN